METVTVRMASRPLLKAGRYHLAACARDKETQGLGTAFKPAHDALDAVRIRREQAEDALIEPRMQARFAETALELVLRDIASKAHDVDRKASGALVFKAIFPNGLDAEVRPRGPGQLTAAMALRGRLDVQPAAAPVKTLLLNDLDAALATLGSALEARRMGENALGLARAAEDGARETFVASYDSNAGAIRQMFPRNRARQSLYFDTLHLDQDQDTTEDGQGTETPALTENKKA